MTVILRIVQVRDNNFKPLHNNFKPLQKTTISSLYTKIKQKEEEDVEKGFDGPEEDVFSYCRMCSLTIECVLLL